MYGELSGETASGPVVSYVLSQVTTGDNFVLAQTLDNLPQIARVNFDVQFNRIKYQMKVSQLGSQGSAQTGAWMAEVDIGPGLFSLDRTCFGLRIRSYATGQPALVTVELITVGELA